MTREGALACVKGKMYTADEVKNLIRQIETPVMYSPRVLAKGDIFATKDTLGKPRPYVIIKVLSDTVIAIPTSTTNDSLCLRQSRSRFLKDGWFSKQFVTVHKDYAMQRWTGVYANPKGLNKAIKELKEYLNNTI